MGVPNRQGLVKTATMLGLLADANASNRRNGGSVEKNGSIDSRTLLIMFRIIRMKQTDFAEATRVQLSRVARILLDSISEWIAQNVTPNSQTATNLDPRWKLGALPFPVICVINLRGLIDLIVVPCSHSCSYVLCKMRSNVPNVGLSAPR